MSKLEPEEIVVGLVSHLDQTMLTNDPDIIDTYPQKTTELRPFVCVKVDGEKSVWAPLSSTYRRERLKIKDEWRQGGIDMWRNRRCYLNDGANTYHGPNTSFIAASINELTTPGTRSQMSLEGIDAVLSEINNQKQRRINGKDA